MRKRSKFTMKRRQMERKRIRYLRYKDRQITILFCITKDPGIIDQALEESNLIQAIDR